MKLPDKSNYDKSPEKKILESWSELLALASASGRTPIDVSRDLFYLWFWPA